MDKKVKILLIVLAVTALVGAGLYLLFGWTEISIRPETAKITLDNKDLGSSYKGYLLIGEHKIKITSTNKYYSSVERGLRIKPGKNNFLLNLPAQKESFIAGLPIDNEKWSIIYTESINSFFVTINADPVEENKADVLRYLESRGVNTTKEKVIWNLIAGVGDAVGP
jgi:hypothetical protein